jgi:death-on-curing protein
MEYPTPADVHAIHRAIVESDGRTEPGVRKPAAVESALLYVSEGYFGQVPETLHEKAFHLMRLLVAEHPYVDGNKRTALTTAVVFYALNDYYFDHDDRIRTILKAFATDEREVEIEPQIVYFQKRTVHESEADGSIQREINRLKASVN